MLVVVPTRGRPQNAVRLLTALRETAAVDVVFCADSNDLMLPGYVAALPPACLIIGEPARLGTWLNKIGTRAAMVYEVIGFMGDDHLPETLGWDLSVLAALDAVGRYGMAYGNDGYRGEELPTAVFMRSSLIAHLGWIVPVLPDGRSLEHLYIDNAWKAIGQKSGALRYLPEVKITHLHPDAGIGEMDETYRAGNSKLQYSRDRAAYLAFQREVLPQIVFPET